MQSHKVENVTFIALKQLLNIRLKEKLLRAEDVLQRHNLVFFSFLHSVLNKCSSFID